MSEASEKIPAYRSAPALVAASAVLAALAIAGVTITARPVVPLVAAGACLGTWSSWLAIKAARRSGRTLYVALASALFGFLAILLLILVVTSTLIALGFAA